jgi:hypothetical protein
MLGFDDDVAQQEPGGRCEDQVRVGDVFRAVFAFVFARRFGFDLVRVVGTFAFSTSDSSYAS